MWILISWLHQKPADLDLHCFQKEINPGPAGHGLTYDHGGHCITMVYTVAYYGSALFQQAYIHMLFADIHVYQC